MQDRVLDHREAAGWHIELEKPLVMTDDEKRAVAWPLMIAGGILAVVALLLADHLGIVATVVGLGIGGFLVLVGGLVSPTGCTFP